VGLAGKQIVLGVTGSISAYKALYLLRLLQQGKAQVKVVTTPSVDRFVGSLSFSSITHEQVFSGLWDESWSEHVTLGTWADLMVIAPATAHTLAKMAHGICDNALTAVYLAARCPVMVAPAMDVDMYKHPRVQHNINILQQDGVNVLPTGKGYLASGLYGEGRLLEPSEIYYAIESHFQSQLLTGKKVLITAGPTREAIDPVRYITNHSSGKMGYALAAEARQLGAEVMLISGPTALQAPDGISLISVESAAQMYEAVQRNAQQHHIIIMAAAVSDYTPAEVEQQKIKKSDQDLTLKLKKTSDILYTLGQQKRVDQILVGFALETENAWINAQKKLKHKNLDIIILNTLEDEGAGFEHDTNKITLINRQGEALAFPLKSKSEVARDIFQHIIQLLAS